jgi:hypothetical protein
VQALVQHKTSSAKNGRAICRHFTRRGGEGAGVGIVGGGRREGAGGKSHRVVEDGDVGGVWRRRSGAHALAKPDAWLAGQGAAPRMLVTAPAGPGKSTLLVQWMESLKDRGRVAEDKWRLAFMPISIRVGTNRPSRSRH